jgi:hypothetical protein
MKHKDLPHSCLVGQQKLSCWRVRVNDAGFILQLSKSITGKWKRRSESGVQNCSLLKQQSIEMSDDVDVSNECCISHVPIQRSECAA